MSRSLLTLVLVVFVDLLGFGIVIPVLPLYALQFGANGFDIGLLMASYSGVQFLLSPFWGRLSDRIGRRPILLFTIAGTVCSLLILGFAQSFTWLILGRVFAGCFAANISTAYAYVSDTTSEENRAKGMGLMGAAMGLGFTLGPAIGGLLSKFGLNAPMFFSAALALVNLVMAYFTLKEPARKKDSSRISLSKTLGFLKNKAVGIPIFIFFLMTMANTQMEVILVIYLKAIFNLDAMTCGLLFGLIGLVMVIIQGSLIGKLAKKFTEVKLIFVASAFGALFFYLFGLTQQHLILAVLLLCLMAASRAILFPSLTSITSKGAEESQRGGVMGLLHSSGSLARVIGPLCAGLLYEYIGKSSPFFFGALFLCTAVVSVKFYPKKTTSIQPSAQ